MHKSSVDRYAAYKDSGVEWLGEVPSEWRVAKVKSTCSHLRDGTHGSFERVDDGFPLLSVRNIVNSEFVLLSDDSCVSALDYKSLSKSLKVKQGDLQLAIVGATLGKVALVPENMPRFVTQRSLATLRPITKILSNRFLFYFAGSSYFQDNLWSKTNYSAQPGVYLYTISSIDMLLPSLPEQTSIAAYLDIKTTKIDRKIDLLSQKAKQYGKLKQSLINETVTRGLDKNVLMKDSGVEWVGEVPEHWILNRHKDNFYLLSDRCDKIEYLKVALENIEGKTGKFIPTSSEFDGNGIAFKKGDILFGKLRPYLAKVYLAEAVGNAVGDIFVYRPKGSITSLFSKYLMLSDRYIDVINGSTAGTKMPRVSSSFIANLLVAVPKVSEQKEITTYLDEKTSKIDRIIETINNQIDKLKALRKALINDVVTGKIKVVES